MVEVEIPDHGIAEFPDNFTPEQISGVIQKQFYAKPESETNVSRGTSEKLDGFSAIGLGNTDFAMPGQMAEGFDPIEAAKQQSSTESFAPIPQIPQQEGIVKETGAALVNTASGLVNFATSPAGLQTLPAAVANAPLGRVLAGLFAPEMVVGGVKEAIHAPTWQGKLQGALGALLGVSGAVHAGGLTEKLNPVLREPEKTPSVVEPTEAMAAPVSPKVESLEPLKTPLASDAFEAELAAAEKGPVNETKVAEGTGRNGAAKGSGEVLGESPGEILPTVEPEPVARSEGAKVDEGVSAAPIKEAESESVQAQGQNEPTPISTEGQPLVLWGRTKGGEWLKLSGNTSNAEMARWQKDGWEVLRYPRGSSPAMAEQAPSVSRSIEEQSAAPVPQKESEISPSVVEGSTANAASTEAAQATPSEIMSPGPGAASAKEPLASYELRKFGERFVEDKTIAPEVRTETGNRFYEPIPNRVTASEAAKIIQERGVDESIRLLKDEKNDVTPAVRGTIGQTVIKKLNEEYRSLAETNPDQAAMVLNKAVDLAEWQMEYGTRLGQGVQAFAMWNRLTPEGKLATFKRAVERAGTEYDPKVGEEIMRLATEVEKASEGMPKDEATKRLNKYIAEQSGYAAKDLPLGIYYGNILSGVNTQLVNAIDTGLNVLHEVNNLAVANPRAAAQIYAGLIRGLGEGKYDALVALQEGRRITEGKIVEAPDLLEASRFGEKGGVPIKVEGKVSSAMKRLAETKPAKILNAWKYVMRTMTASDTVMFRGAQEARAGLLAFRLAEATGIEKTKLRAEADRILGFDRLDEFRKQAEAEGYSGAKADARATELMIQSRPESLRSDASDFAGIATYNHEPRGMLGYFANSIGKASEKYPALKLFVPFTRIVANVTNRGLDNTPWGFRRALVGYGSEKLTGEARQIALTRAIAGTSALIGIGVLSATGKITLHGAGPSDQEKKKQLQNAGWRPYSIQVGDNYFTYTYTPIGLGLSVMANYMDSQRYNELSQKDVMTRTIYSMSRIGSTVFNQSFLSGMSNLFEILSGSPGKTISSLKRFFSSAVTGATTPTILRDVNGIFDPKVRQSDSIAQDMVRNIPLARLSLKPALNAFGEPVEPPRNRFMSSAKDDPAWKIVVEKSLRVPVADETVFREVDDAYRYSQETGRRMKQYILSNLTALRGKKDEDAQEQITKAAQNIFEDVRQRIKGGGAPVRDRKHRK